MRAMSVYDMLMTRYDGREGTMDRNLVSSAALLMCMFVRSLIV